MNVDVVADGRLQFFHTSEDSATDALVCDLDEPAFDQVDPGTVGRGEMDMKARSFGEPLPDERGFCVCRSYPE